MDSHGLQEFVARLPHLGVGDWALDDVPLVAAPPARPSDSALAQSHRLVMDDSRRKLAPLLQVTSSEDFLEQLSAVLDDFRQSRLAMQTLFRLSGAAAVDPEEGIRVLRTRFEVLGPNAVEDYDFAASTYHRAVVLAKRFPRLSRTSPIEMRRREFDLLEELQAYSDIFYCVQFVLFLAIERPFGPPATEVALETSFQFLRDSALGAYVAARTRSHLFLPVGAIAIDDPDEPRGVRDRRIIAAHADELEAETRELLEFQVRE